MHSLQNKIFFFFVVLLLTVQGIAIWTISNATDQQSRQSIKSRLETATTIFNKLYQSRNEKLAAVAQTAAQDGALRENFFEDQRSFLYALNNHRKRIKADIALVIDDQEIIKAQLINRITNEGKFQISRGPEIGQKFLHREWLDLPDEDYLYALEDNLFQVSIAPIKIGSENIGWIIFGFAIDQTLAIEFAELTGLATDFVVKQNNNIQGFASSQSPRSNLSVLQNILTGKTPSDLIATFIELQDFGLQPPRQLKVVLHGSRDDLLAAIEARWIQFVLLAGITLLLSLGGAFVISASITKPVTQLVEWAQCVAKGNYNEPVNISDKGEIGQLANEFNLMQREIVSREKTIAHQAYHDPLTNLPNRNQLLIEVSNHANNQLGELSFLNINVGHIGDINKSLGHQVGDQVIIEIANRLAGVAKDTSLFHIGGDGFILLFKSGNRDKITKLLKKMDETLTRPYENDAMALELKVTVGVVTYPSQASNPEELLQKSDTAMQNAKSRKQSYQFYDPSQDIDVLEQLNLMNDLNVAIKEDQLLLHYQPKVNLKNNQTESLEALVRWQHPELGMIPPDRFIPIAERTGQINALTYWVLEEAASQYAKWQKKGILLKIAVNISAENLKANNFFEFVCSLTNKYKIPVDAIVLEVTESAVVEDPKKAIALLQKFKQYGFKLSIDDYGTGYSSLAQLKDLPVDELKIDMSFVKSLPNEKGDKIIVHSTIELAHNMGLTVVAEGVENQQAMDWLRNASCETAQGYHISRPLPAEQLELWLSQTVFYTNTSHDNVNEQQTS